MARPSRKRAPCPVCAVPLDSARCIQTWSEGNWKDDDHVTFERICCGGCLAVVRVCGRWAFEVELQPSEVARFLEFQRAQAESGEESTRTAVSHIRRSRRLAPLLRLPEVFAILGGPWRRADEVRLRSAHRFHCEPRRILPSGKIELFSVDPREHDRARPHVRRHGGVWKPVLQFRSLGNCYWFLGSTCFPRVGVSGTDLLLGPPRVEIPGRKRSWTRVEWFRCRWEAVDPVTS